ncbi:toxin-antitoxin system YwqK family antitoxin [Campylobacter sp. TTU_617]|uniref:toxin-antitoxin system YwqK family antitoxin n=1 Tax=Campylobacter sp. TTU_617 TaxID=2768148 RepID=UPI00190857A2|nr:toxin-antitoxin system YwqK family antitoxin [Campylobacter sp. TTU_617]MBK1972238.1 toxin-antitoxin system YwqK family antitoxin [Campylobacter sp. TTU_617]
MKKFLSVCSIVAVLLSGCGSDFPGQPSDVVRVQQNKYPSGNLKEEIPYNKESRIHGLKRTFYDNGQLKTEENYKNGKKDGVRKQYSREGQLLEEMNFKDNRGYGNFVRYYNNGNIRAKGKLLNFDEDGMPEFEGSYNEYYQDGKPALEYNFDNKGKQDGIQKTFNEDGSLESEENYKNGIKNGIFKYYKNGEIVKEEEFKNGVLIQKPKN